ncbi:hypothetical protein ACH347_30970 [Saccharopolyspora sp. 5N102]|uniref:hypothetical protein n=1 Tax=Saccharopolyspora sp. 5N102 TaxID=3375155 RepID=UPI0037A5DA5E
MIAEQPADGDIAQGALQGENRLRGQRASPRPVGLGRGWRPSRLTDVIVSLLVRAHPEPPPQIVPLARLLARFVRRTGRAGSIEGSVDARPAPATAPSSELRSDSLLLGRM